MKNKFTETYIVMAILIVISFFILPTWESRSFLIPSTIFLISGFLARFNRNLTLIGFAIGTIAYFIVLSKIYF